MASSANSSNRKPQLFYVTPQDKDDYGNPGPPRGADKVHNFIESGGYRPGDIINFDDYRFSFAYIVALDEATGQFHLIANPDDSNAGYLTLPEEVLEGNGDVLGTYADVMQDIANMGHASITFHLPTSDKFVRDKFGPDIPEGWRFEAEFIANELEMFLVCPPGSEDFRNLDYSTLTWPKLQAAFEYRDEPQTALKVSVRLEGDKLEAYKTEKGDPNDEYAWLHAKPSVPISWELESGGGGGGSDEHHSSWILKGPQRHKEEVRQKVENFFKGYDFEICIEEPQE